MIKILQPIIALTIILRLTALILLCFAVPAQAQADIYKWIDADGHTQFSDQKPANLQLKPLELKVNSYESISYGKSNTSSANKNAGRKIMMYSTDWCAYCKKARHYFAQQSIAYTEYDIEKNPVAMARYRKLGASGVPVIFVGKKRMNGFSIQGFRKLYTK